MKYFLAFLVGVAAATFIRLLAAMAIETGIVALKITTLASIIAAGAIEMAILEPQKQQGRRKH